MSKKKKSSGSKYRSTSTSAISPKLKTRKLKPKLLAANRGMLSSASQQLRKGQLLQAQVLCEKVMSNNPADDLASLLLAKIHLQQKQYEPADIRAAQAERLCAHLAAVHDPIRLPPQEVSGDAESILRVVQARPRRGVRDVQKLRRGQIGPQGDRRRR